MPMSKALPLKLSGDLLLCSNCLLTFFIKALTRCLCQEMFDTHHASTEMLMHDCPVKMRHLLKAQHLFKI